MKIDVKVNLKTIVDNIKSYQSDVILMVKSDGYGHGMTEVAQYTEPHVFGFGVATIEEGIALRQVGIKLPVLVSQWQLCELDDGVSNNLSLTVSDLETLRAVAHCKGKAVLKINTGMNRFGFDSADIPSLKEELSDIALNGIYSHIYSTDSADKQIHLFDSVLSTLSKGCDAHILASLTAKNRSGEILRIGIGAYEGAMTVESKVVAVRRLHIGDNVGYGNTLMADGYVAWVFGGYYDGISREQPQPVIINDKLCETVAVCMDCMAVFTGEYVPNIGERVILQNDILTPELIAMKTKTIPYTVLVGRKGRINRTYTKV